MTLKEDLLCYLLEYFPAWGNTPGNFLEFIRSTASLSNAVAGIQEMQGSWGPVDEAGLANIFIGTFGVDISPYQSFDELAELHPGEVNVAELLDALVSRAREEEALDALIEDNGLQPSLETMLEALTREEQVQSVVDRLRPFIHFV